MRGESGKIVDGNVELSPAIISEKKMPIDSVMPLF